MLPPQEKYIEVISNRKTLRVYLDRVAFAVTDAHYLDIGLLDGEKLRCRMTMGEFIGLTDKDSRFLLINKGIAVNVEYILGFEDNCCILENGGKFPIRVRDRLKIQQAARDYHFRKIRRNQRHRKGD